MEKFTADIVVALRTYKKSCGIESMRQGYKGTGCRAHRRQLFITFESKRTIDIWFEDRAVSFSGVCQQVKTQVSYLSDGGERKTPELIASEVGNILSVYKQHL